MRARSNSAIAERMWSWRRPAGRGSVDTLAEGDEGDTSRLEFVQQEYEVPEVAPEPIESPHDKHVEAPPLGVLHERIEGRSRLPSAADPVVHVLADLPLPEVGVGTQLAELVLRFLVECRDTSVEGGTHVDVLG
jgi:hypothetical protein